MYFHPYLRQKHVGKRNVGKELLEPIGNHRAHEEVTEDSDRRMTPGRGRP